MPWTEEEKQAELKRVTEISGFCVGGHALLAEVDPDALKARNDQWEKQHGKMSREERMQHELTRALVYIGSGKAAHHAAIHIHMAHECGATKEHIWYWLNKAAQWGGAPECSHNAREAYRIVFMPDFPTVYRIVELTSDSVPSS